MVNGCVSKEGTGPALTLTLLLWFLFVVRPLRKLIFVSLTALREFLLIADPVRVLAKKEYNEETPYLNIHLRPLIPLHRFGLIVTRRRRREEEYVLLLKLRGGLVRSDN